MTSPRLSLAVLFALGLGGMAAACAGAAPSLPRHFIEAHCVDCHDSETRKGDLDLTSLPFEMDGAWASRWVLIHDRVSQGEMPPPKKARPDAAAAAAFTQTLSNALVTAETDRRAREGRATQRRMNRYEYENALRDLLNAPWLQIKDALPEDGEAHRFNKVGDALDVSHVQMARYLNAADYALRQAMAPYAEQPPADAKRHYARDQRSYTGPMKYSVFNTAPERATFPVLGLEGQPEVRAGKAPITAGDEDPERRNLEGVGVVASAYEPIEPKFNQFRAPVPGRYKLRFNAYTVWVGPGEGKRWFIPNLDDISRGRRDEPVTITAETPPRLLRKLGDLDVTPEPSVYELETLLLAGEMIRPDAGRLFRSRPGASRWRNPLAEEDGQPGVVFRWLEVEGPLYESWPPAGHRLMFGDLPMATRAVQPREEEEPSNSDRRRRPRFIPAPGVEVISQRPREDARRLLKDFVRRAYRHPVADRDWERFMPVAEQALDRGLGFTDAMIAAYTAVLCSPEFLCLKEAPGRLDPHALAARLSFFLWNSPPDEALRAAADQGELSRAETLRFHTERLLDDPKSMRFIDGFLDYWLDLRRLTATAPDSGLYPDYYLDDLLTESVSAEPRAFMAELLRGNLPARHLIDSEFAMVNETLAAHYGLPPVGGVALRRASLPAGSVRGGLMTQAAVLKVTANGTTTSPVLRGAWVMERLLGQKPPPPPPSVPAVEPDIRGATTIREQLDRHRTSETCNACHAKIDPAGFALEHFDVMGGWRDRYRAEGGGEPAPGLGKSGQKFSFHYARPVDASGVLADGRAFGDVRELKRLLLADERMIARNLARQYIVYATGAPIGFSDRHAVEGILDRARADQYGVRRLIHEVVQSDLFLMK